MSSVQGLLSIPPWPNRTGIWPIPGAGLGDLAPRDDNPKISRVCSRQPTTRWRRPVRKRQKPRDALFIPSASFQQPSEIGTLTGAIKGGPNHSFQASFDAELSALTDDQAAFQYEIQPAQLSPESSLAVREALDGDLSRLTAMEDGLQDGGILAPGVKMLNSVLVATRQRGVTLKLNLLGILNFLTVSELIRHSEVLTDAVTGDVTIKETVSGNNITAIVEPLARNEALRKAIFESVLATTSYRAGKAVALPDLHCEQMHFALNQNTNHQLMGDYLSWFLALNLLNGQDEAAILSQFTDGGPSTCALRTSFADADCTAMFFDGNGALRAEQQYLEIGREALRAVLDPQHQAIDGLRDGLLDDAHWPQALDIGANVNLGPLVGLGTDDVRVEYLIGDVMVITDWAEAMAAAGQLIQDVRAFVGDADPNTLFQDNQFQNKRDALQKKLAGMVKASKTRFDEPWGMICLFQAAGSPQTAYAKAVTQKLAVERGAQPALAAAKGIGRQARQRCCVRWALAGFRRAHPLAAVPGSRPDEKPNPLARF